MILPTLVKVYLFIYFNITIIMTFTYHPKQQKVFMMKTKIEFYLHYLWSITFRLMNVHKHQEQWQYNFVITIMYKTCNLIHLPKALSNPLLPDGVNMFTKWSHPILWNNLLFTANYTPFFRTLTNSSTPIDDW